MNSAVSCTTSLNRSSVARSPSLAVHELGVVDRVRLLPDEERADARRRLRAARVGHLRPAGARVALARGGGARPRQDPVVVAEAPLQQRQPAPQREVRGVPPVHLEVELAVPAVEGEPGLLRRVAAGALDGREVLRQDDAPLELAPARVAAHGEVDGAARGPEAIPVLACLSQGLVEARERLGDGAGREADRDFERVSAAARGEQVVVPRVLGQSARGSPGEAHLVAVVVQAALQDGASWFRADERRLVGVGSGPVGRGRVASPVREAQPDRDLPAPDERRDDAHRDRVQPRMAQGLDVHLLTVQAEAAAEHAPPQVEDLLDVLDVVTRRLAPVPQPQPEADASQVESVRVLAQPLDLGCALVAGDVGVPDLVAARVELGEAKAVDRIALGVGRGVPAPLRERAERDRLVVGFSERLQAGRVGSEGELAVADRERRARVEAAQHRIVAGDERLPVDGAGVRGASHPCDQEQQQREADAGHRD